MSEARQTCFVFGLLINHESLHAALEELGSKASRPEAQRLTTNWPELLPAGRVDVRVSVETEAVLTHFVHPEVGLQVQNSTAQIIFLGPFQHRSDSTARVIIVIKDTWGLSWRMLVLVWREILARMPAEQSKCTSLPDLRSSKSFICYQYWL